MTDTLERSGRAAGRYSSPAGVDMESVPWRLYDKAKRLFWDPNEIDYSKEAGDWDALSREQKMMLASTTLGFMVGEEAVTLDILPLVRAISDEGRLEETMFLTTFALEEAKHVEFFRRWANAVGVDFTPYVEFAGGAGKVGYGGNIFDGELERVMKRLETDRCPEAFLDAALTYNQFVEGVLALGAYQMTDLFFSIIPGLPALREGFSLIQRDERRHIAYGTYLCRRIISEHPETWEFVERRWEELTRPYLAMQMSVGGPSEMQVLADRRIEVMAVARNQTPDDVEHTSADELEETAE